MKPGCIGKSNTNNLPAHTNLTENPYGEKKLCFFDATQKSPSMVPWEPIFEKCSHLREKGGVLTQIRARWGIACPVLDVQETSIHKSTGSWNSRAFGSQQVFIKLSIIDERAQHTITRSSEMDAHKCPFYMQVCLLSVLTNPLAPSARPTVECTNCKISSIPQSKNSCRARQRSQAT
jgi:hypothetical protein